MFDSVNLDYNIYLPQEFFPILCRIFIIVSNRHTSGVVNFNAKIIAS